MDSLDKTYVIPESLQAIVDGLKSERRPTRCLQCRALPSNHSNDESLSQSTLLPTVKKLVRCSRCQVAHYCNVACQRIHFNFHKGGCKSIFKKRIRVEDSRQCHHGPTSESMLVKVMVDMADELVIMGYRETVTFENGRVHYRKALYWYMEVYKILQGSIFEPPENSLEDKVLLLLVLLGANTIHIKEWCMASGSPRLGNFGPPTIESPDEFQMHGLATKDTTFHCLILLVSMRSLAQYRRDLEAFQAFQSLFRSVTTATTRPAEFLQYPRHFLWETLLLPFLLGNAKEDGTRHLDVLPTEIRLLVRAMEYHGTKSYLVHLRDSIPLSPHEHAPELFRGGAGAIDPQRPLLHTPHEFWYLYQDAFFMTPGVNDILHEFVPEQDDDFGDDDSS